jgi:ADP-heptose:LPS heptosyltransferase
LRPIPSHQIVSSILTIDLSPFGASLSALPALRALRDEYPQASLIAAACSGACELIKCAAPVDDVIDLGVIKSSDRRYTSLLRRLAILVRRSRQYDFDLVLDFSPRIETQIASRLFMRARTITPSRLPRAVEMLLDVAGVTRPFERAVASNYQRVLAQAGVEMADSSFQISVPEEEHARFEQRLVKAGSRGAELLVLLYASDPNDPRGWPVQHFADVSARLANNFDARMILADEPSDSAFTNALSAWPIARALKVAEPRALELVAAIARASIAVTDEPAIAKIASELGTPAIEIAEVASSRQSTESRGYRVLSAASRSRIAVDEVYDTACEMIHNSRTTTLFQ